MNGRNPVLAGRIIRFNILEAWRPPIQHLRISLRPNPDGLMNLAHAGGALHSTRDPLKEAQRFADSLAHDISHGPKSALLLIVGIGWGHHIGPVLKALPEHDVIFLEPVVEVRELLTRGRLAELRAAGARIAEDPHALRKILHREFPGRTPVIRILPAYARLFPNLMSTLEDLLGGTRTQSSAPTDVDDATSQRFMRQWARNFFIRLREGENLEFLSSDFDQAHHGPPGPDVLYCGAGPGLLADLQPHLPMLRRNERNLRILVVDSALGPLLHEGIRPDLVLSVDSGRGTAYHYRAGRTLLSDGAEQDKLPFTVLTWTAGPRFARQWFQRVVYYRSTFPFDQILADQIPATQESGPLSSIPEWRNSARNPAGLALLFARTLGSRNVHLAGADFRAREDRSHERGTGYAMYALDGVNRVRTLEMYRPGGYGAEALGKNRLALDGLKKLATKLNLKAGPLSRETNFSVSPGDVPASNPEIPVTTVDPRRARGHLKQVWQHLDFSSLPGPPDAAQSLVWHRLLK